MTDLNNKLVTETGAAPGDDAANSKRSKMRYFKATDGRIIVFRGSPTRVYLSASFVTFGASMAKYQPAGAISFSAKPPNSALGMLPADEIGKVEFDTLMQAKTHRVKAAGRDLRFNSSPSDSWCTVSEADAAGLRRQARDFKRSNKVED